MKVGEEHWEHLAKAVGHLDKILKEATKSYDSFAASVENGACKDKKTANKFLGELEDHTYSLIRYYFNIVFACTIFTDTPPRLHTVMQLTTPYHNIPHLTIPHHHIPTHSPAPPYQTTPHHLMPHQSPPHQTTPIPPPLTIIVCLCICLLRIASQVWMRKLEGLIRCCASRRLMEPGQLARSCRWKFFLFVMC